MSNRWPIKNACTSLKPAQLCTILAPIKQIDFEWKKSILASSEMGQYLIRCTKTDKCHGLKTCPPSSHTHSYSVFVSGQSCLQLPVIYTSPCLSLHSRRCSSSQFTSVHLYICYVAWHGPSTKYYDNHKGKRMKYQLASSKVAPWIIFF